MSHYTKSCENPFKDEKILLVTHSGVMSALHSSGVNPSTGRYINYKHFNNCEVVPYHFDLRTEDGDVKMSSQK